MNEMTSYPGNRLPLSANQKRLWLMSLQDSENPAYNLQLTYQICGSPDIDLLTESLRILFHRQHTLFSVFRQAEGMPYILIEPRDVTIDVVDFSQYPSAVRKEKILSFAGAELRRSFDLEKGPLYRLFLLKENEDSFVFHAVVHHIVFDGWSMGFFGREISRIYTSLKRGSYVEGAPLQFHSYDFAREEKPLNAGPETDILVDFWKETLSDSPSELKFPYDYPRKSSLTGLGHREPFFIPKTLTVRLKELALTEKSSLFKTLLSVLGIFMQKYTGENDICIGFPVSGRRDSSALDEIFGFFVNTSLVRLKIDDDDSFRKQLRDSTQAASSAIRNSKLPFDKIIEVVNPERRPNMNPLFQVSLSWWNDVTSPLNLNGLICERINIPEGVAPMDISFYMWEEGDHIEGELECASDLISGETVKLMTKNFVHLIELLVEKPDSSLSTVSMIGADDLKMISVMNQTQTDYPSDKTVIQLFEEEVINHPEKKALSYNDSYLTYNELNIKANRLARTLRDAGVKTDTPVGVFMDKSIEIIVSLLAIMKAGGAYLPIDPEFPVARVEFILNESDCKLILTQTKYLDVPLPGIRKINIDSADSFSSDSSNLNIATTPLDLAYIIYTSGTTGTPKGTCIPHRGVVRLVRNTNYIDFSREDNVLFASAIVFDASAIEIWGTLLNGGTLFIVTKEIILNPKELGDNLEKNSITILAIATPLFIQLAEYRTEIFRKLKNVIVGGDILSAPHANKVRRDNPQLTLINGYGPTENSTMSTIFKVEKDYDYNIPIGIPMSNSTAYIFDKYMNYQPVGVIGELYVGGDGISRGYLKRDDLNKKCFIEHPFMPGTRIYKTGDYARWLPDGNIEFHGRIDGQVKIRGYRVEIGEIETAIFEFSDIKNCAVKVVGQETRNPQVAAYIVTEKNEDEVVKGLKRYLSNRLPLYMVPAHIVVLDDIPMTASGKIDRKALPVPEAKAEKETDGPHTDIEEILITVWKKILNIDAIGSATNFFEAGGTSILIPGIIENLKKNYNISVKSLNIFEYPTIKMLADFISMSGGEIAEKKEEKAKDGSGPGLKTESRDIAVIGMAGCFPGADSVNELWDIVKSGSNAGSFFSREELENKGVPAELLDNPGYVYANYMIGRAGMFEPSFFDITPREADFMDPQHRLFLEVCYEALEDAGYAPRSMPRNIGVFAGAGVNNYLLKSLLSHPEALVSIGEFQNMVNNEKDFLATRVSYKLNLTGPSLDIQTACSTSLVAIHVACQSLLNGECDMALGGGVSLQFPRGKGYMQEKGSILSPNGYCRPFDSKADGTVVGEGAAVIMLKRLDDAVKDHDHIYAVIKATAINNDGSVKVGYMAPGLEGQTRVIRKAQEAAGVLPDSIAFVETHGTGTKLGDPIEIAALKKVFPVHEDKKPYCALGAVKANIGHLDAASGATGVIKAILALRHKQIPPIANFESYNPELEMEGSPFYIADRLIEWPPMDTPRRAAISSFGIGGTNAHCIIEEYNQASDAPMSNVRMHLLPLSAKTPASLEMLNNEYLSFFKETKHNIADIAYTMQTGREHFRYRQMFTAKDLKDVSSSRVSRGVQNLDNPRVVFMFTGQGSQYRLMSKDLYENFATFRKEIDAANDILKKECDLDLIDLLFSPVSSRDINDTENAQPALVAVQYATAKLLGEFGIKPDILIGHSIGELTAAAVSGLLSFRDMLILAARRGAIMQSQEKGSMLSVNLSADELQQKIVQGVEISLKNAPDFCVVSGTEKDIFSFRARLEKELPEVKTAVLKTSHAFHSYLMEKAVTKFREIVEGVSFGSIGIPFVSNTSGAVIKTEDARSPLYWADHIRKPVDFESGISGLLLQQNIFMEIGPGSMLTSLLSRFKSEKEFKAIPTMRGAKQETNDSDFFLNALAQFWITGGNIDWNTLYDSHQSKVALPTYSFNRKLHWIEPKTTFSFINKTEGPDRDPLLSDNSPETDVDTTDRSGFSEPYIEPENDVQKQLVKIWEFYLGVKPIGIGDDFFTMGGHSLLASQVINNINAHFKSDLSIETIFKTPTIGRLEPLLEEGKSNKMELKLSSTPDAVYLPVSNEQVRLWMISQLDNNPAYNIPFTYKLKGKLNESVFVRSINEVFNRHSVLRGRIVTVDIDPALVLDNRDSVSVSRLDFSDIAEPERTRKIEDFVSKDIRRVFDIENDHLYRNYLIKCSEDEYLFHMTIHHINFDGWSWGIFVRDLKKAYLDLMKGESVKFNEEAFQYYEFARWQNENVTEAGFEKSLGYWTDQLRGINGYLNFPYDYPRKEYRSGLGSREFFTVDSEVRSKLREIAKTLNVTDFVIYISAFSILLNRYSKDNDICIGIPSANRFGSQIEKIIGFFVNTLVLRFKPDANMKFSSYLNVSKKSIVDALENQDLPFEKIVESLQPSRQSNSNPVFQVLFAWLNTPSEIFEFPDVKVERCHIIEGVAPLDITFYLWDEKESLTGEVEYSVDILASETIHLLIDDYLRLLTAIADNPERVIGDL